MHYSQIHSEEAERRCKCGNISFYFTGHLLRQLTIHLCQISQEGKTKEIRMKMKMAIILVFGLIAISSGKGHFFSVHNSIILPPPTDQTKLGHLNFCFEFPTSIMTKWLIKFEIRSKILNQGFILLHFGVKNSILNQIWSKLDSSLEAGNSN